MNSFYSYVELQEIGFKKLGNNVLISKKTSIYNPQNMEIGDNVRIDDFCLLSGKIVIGNHVHIAAYVSLFAGNAGIVVNDYAGLSSRCAVYAASDDYSGNALTNPTIPDEFRNVINEKVVIGKHVVVGTGSTILPGVEIGEGTSVGSMSLVNKSLEPWGIYVGIPSKRIKDRSKRLLELEKQFVHEAI